MVPNILFNCPNQLDATSFYRAVGPFNALRKSGYDLRFIQTTGEPGWALLSFADILFSQRPVFDWQLKNIKHAKEQNIPVWVDLDDDLFSIPPDNPSCNFLGLPSQQKIIQESLQLADIVTVPTEVLKAKIMPLNPYIMVIPNAIDLTMFPRKPEPFVRNKIVMWRGSPTHHEDLRLYSDVILQCHNDYPDYIWAFLGFDPYWITRKMDRKRWVTSPSVDSPITFLKAGLQEAAAAIHIVPLVDCPFNRAKSNIAFIEAAWAGSTVIAPTWNAGHIGYQDFVDGQTFSECLNNACNCNSTELNTINNAQWEYVRDNHDLAKVNLLRRQVISILFRTPNE